MIPVLFLLQSSGIYFRLTYTCNFETNDLLIFTGILTIGTNWKNSGGAVVNILDDALDIHLTTTSKSKSILGNLVNTILHIVSTDISCEHYMILNDGKFIRQQQTKVRKFNIFKFLVLTS